MFFFAFCTFGTPAVAHPSLIPLPASIIWHDGAVPVGPDTVVEGRGEADSIAGYLSQSLALKRIGRGSSRIRLSLVSSTDIPNPEGYRLRARGNAVLIESSDPRGLFYGAQTLLQLIEATPDGHRSVAAVEIRDAPRFRWRGLLIDLGRHFFGKIP